MLFYLFMYDYSFSLGGYLLGRSILGNFFESNKHLSQKQVRANAEVYFRDFQRMVRPLEFLDLSIHGTLSDGKFLICLNNEGQVWAAIVFLKFMDRLTAVLVPAGDLIGGKKLFLDFLAGDQEELTCTLGQFTGSKIENSGRFRLLWPCDTYV